MLNFTFGAIAFCWATKSTPEKIDRSHPSWCSFTQLFLQCTTAAETPHRCRITWKWNPLRSRGSQTTGQKATTTSISSTPTTRTTTTWDKSGIFLHNGEFQEVQTFFPRFCTGISTLFHENVNVSFLRRDFMKSNLLFSFLFEPFCNLWSKYFPGMLMR